MAELEGYDVGYGKPPRATQFQKGQSGNPKGRPKGSENMETILQRTLMEKIRVVVNGSPRMVPKVEVAVTQAVNQAAGGSLKALKEILDLWRWTESRGRAQEPDEATDEPGNDREVLEQLAARIRGQFKPGSDVVGLEGGA